MNAMAKNIQEKLAILSDAARYDASCASSGTSKRDSRDGKGLGSTDGNGICHSFTPDGRCVSLLKILMTNFCVFDCAYCVNRVSSNVERARFTPEEVVKLTLEFYRRNYIEGLFLSSGIIKSPDDTMRDMVRIVKSLREEHDFRGYIHLKTIPGASPELIEEAGLHADRLSVNIELPTEISLAQFAPEKDAGAIRKHMGDIRLRREASEDTSHKGTKPKVFAPAGQSTQMIVGADATNDATILKQSARLYGSYGLKRVYYSAFSPIPDSTAKLPLVKPPLMREHRLYQADWLMRFYEFSAEEIARTATSTSPSTPSSPGRSRTASAFRSTSSAPPARCFCASRASAPRPWTASSPRAATGRSATTTCSAWGLRSRRRSRSSSCPTGPPASFSTPPTCGRSSRPSPSSSACSDPATPGPRPRPPRCSSIAT